MKIKIFLIFLFITGNAFSQANPVNDVKTGNEFLEQGDHFNAIKFFREALKKNSNYLEALEGLAESFFLLEEYDEALIHIQKAASLGKTQNRIKNLWGRILLGQGKLEEGKKKFLDVLNLDHKNIGAALGLGEYHLLGGRYFQAEAQWSQVLATDSANLRAALSLVLLRSFQKDYRKAEAALQTAMQFHSGEPKVHLFASLFYKDRQRFSEALKAVDKFLELTNPFEKIKGVYLKAEILLLAKNPSPVLDLIGKNLNDSKGLYLKGRAFADLGRVGEAINHWTLAIEKEKENEIYRLARENLVIEKLPMEDPIRSNVAQFHFDLAGDLKRRNQIQGAQDELRRGLTIFPDHADGLLTSAELYKTLGFKVSSLERLESIKSKGLKPKAWSEAEYLLQKNAFRDNFAHGKDWGLNLQDFGSAGEPFLHRPYKIGVFYDPTQSRLSTLNGAAEISNFIATELSSQPLMDIKVLGSEASFDQAFQKSRTQGLDFFIMLSFNQGERSILSKGQIFLARTGTEVFSSSIRKQGSWMINSGGRELSKNLTGFFPLKGVLIKRKANLGDGLINLGSRNGVQKDQKFTIIKENRIRYSGDRQIFTYQKEDMIGTFTVTKIDDWVSEGKITKNGSFDTISTGDDVFFMKEIPPGQAPVGVPLAQEIQREILNLR